jgi:acetyltransferase-like isoleucine patch superfamily enzyme
MSALAAIRRALWLYRYSRLGEWEKVRMFDLGSVGERVRITGIVDFGSEPYLIHLGSDVTLTADVRFVNHDGGVGVLRGRHPGLNVYDTITVGDRVFIGTRSIILPGVSIGSDVVIGAGSVVTRDVPDGTVAAGTPCRPIRPLEEYEQRALERATYWQGHPAARELKRHILAGVNDRREWAPHG